MTPLFDLSPRAMAVRFGQLALGRIRDGRDCAETARLAVSYAQRALIEEAVDAEEAAGVWMFGRPGETG